MKHTKFYCKFFNEFRNGKVKIFTFFPALDFKMNYEAGVKVRVFVLSWLIWSLAIGWSDCSDWYTPRKL